MYTLAFLILLNGGLVQQGGAIKGIPDYSTCKKYEQMLRSEQALKRNVVKESGCFLSTTIMARD
jgi:hypothetical protein